MPAALKYIDHWEKAYIIEWDVKEIIFTNCKFLFNWYQIERKA